MKFSMFILLYFLLGTITSYAIDDNCSKNIQYLIKDYEDSWSVDIDVLEDVLATCDDIDKYPILYLLKGELLLTDNMTAVALLYYERCHETAIKEGDIEMLIRAKLALSNTHFLLENIDRSYSYVTDALQLIQENPNINNASEVKLNGELSLIENLIKKKEFKKATTRCWKLYSQYKEESYAAEVLGSLIQISSESKDDELLSTVIKTFEQDSLLIKSDKYYAFHYYLGKADLLLSQKRFKDAVVYNDSTLALSNRYGFNAEKKAALNNYITIFSNLNKPDTVQIYQDSLKQFTLSQDSIYDVRVLDQVKAMDEYQRLERSNNNILIIGIVIAAAFLLTALVWFIRKRYKNQILLKEKNETKLTTERESLLADNINLSRSNQTKGALLKSALDSMSSDHNLRTDREMLNQIRVALAASNYEPVVINEEKLLFTSTIKEQLPSFTKTEVDIAFYIKVGLTTVEISEVLNRSVRSIESFRYRMRKKTKETLDQSLDELLA